MNNTHEYLVNTRFPEFSLLNDNDKIVSNTQLDGKWNVIFFYPKDESPGCTIQSCSFRDRIPEFDALGVQIFGICLLYTSPSPRDYAASRMPSSA